MCLSQSFTMTTFFKKKCPTAGRQLQQQMSKVRPCHALIRKQAFSQHPAFTELLVGQAHSQAEHRHTESEVLSVPMLTCH